MVTGPALWVQDYDVPVRREQMEHLGLESLDDAEVYVIVNRYGPSLTANLQGPLVVNSATHRLSLTHELIEAGLERKVVCSAARGQGKDLSAFERLWGAGKIELVCLPQGTFAECIRAGGAGIPAS